jgi:hypothetical protein
MFIHGEFSTSFVMLFGLKGPQPQIRGGLNVVYNSNYFYVMC